jgi:hypothetical protein
LTSSWRFSERSHSEPLGWVSSKFSSLPAPWPWNSLTNEHFLRRLARFPFPTVTSLHILILPLVRLPRTADCGEPVRAARVDFFAVGFFAVFFVTLPRAGLAAARLGGVLADAVATSPT